MNEGRSERFSLRSKTLVLVEGREDRFVLEQFADQLHLGPDRIQTHPLLSKDKLFSFLHAEAKRPEFLELETLAILFDAETSRETTLAEINDALQRLDLPASLRVVIETIPTGAQTGCLEDLMLEALTAETAAFPCLDEIRNCIETNLPRSRTFSECQWKKLQLHVVLGCSERGYKAGLLTALQSREYQPILASRVFDPLRQFISQLAEQPAPRA